METIQSLLDFKSSLALEFKQTLFPFYLVNHFALTVVVICLVNCFTQDGFEDISIAIFVPTYHLRSKKC